MKKAIVFLILLSGIQIACNRSTHQRMSSSSHSYTNELIHSSSPYLLQHAHNPVDWFPWGKDVLDKAIKEDKLLIISIGYAACHWCHVMEHESFEDTTVAALMNEHFVSIKVDREERPDVDQIYMNAALLTAGRGGWPLNAIALPDGRPIFAATYFPKEEWMRVLQYFVDLKAKNPEELEKNAAYITQGIQRMDFSELLPQPDSFEPEILEKAYDNVISNIDFKKGGLRRAPKFPMPVIHDFLMTYHFFNPDSRALDGLKVTLDEMFRGGIYDQVGGGFARYSTDGFWRVPHFEKMLYDNGQLISLYANAYKLTRTPDYKNAIEETLEFIGRELTDASGGFYSSLDADSEGEEGKFYVWSESEIDTILGDQSAPFKDYYNVKKDGNWEGSNILFITSTLENVAENHDLSPAELETIIQNGKQKLLKAREGRIRPGLDDKILTSWNALMLKGYVDAYRALDKEEYLQTALGNAEFILENQLRKDGGLFRNHKDGVSSINAFADDYSFTIEAFISLYQATFNEKWIQHADQLMKYSLEHFYDQKSGTFFYTSDEDDPLISRSRELSDNVIPSSNSSFGKGLFALGTYLYNDEYIGYARQILSNSLPGLEKDAAFYSNYAILASSFIHPPFEVAIVGDQFEGKRKELDQHFLPNVLMLGGQKEGSLELLQNKAIPGETFIYVCKDKSCKLPVQDTQKALEQMK